MDSDKPSHSREAPTAKRQGVLVGREVTVRRSSTEPPYFTELHRERIGKTGRVHAIVPTSPRDNPLVKVGFDGGTQIVFFQLGDLEVRADSPIEPPRKHGRRGSHLPQEQRT